MPALAIFGITGRMGQSLVRALRETPAFTLSGAIASARSDRLGQDAAGDLFCRVVIETPVGLGGEQKELLRKFEASLREGSHQPREQSFFEGVKKFFTGAVD